MRWDERDVKDNFNFFGLHTYMVDLLIEIGNIQNQGQR